MTYTNPYTGEPKPPYMGGYIKPRLESIGGNFVRNRPRKEHSQFVRRARDKGGTPSPSLKEGPRVLSWRMAPGASPEALERPYSYAGSEPRASMPGGGLRWIPVGAQEVTCDRGPAQCTLVPPEGGPVRQSPPPKWGWGKVWGWVRPVEWAYVWARDTQHWICGSNTGPLLKIPRGRGSWNPPSPKNSPPRQETL